MGDRRARIPASEVGDEPRNWNLPFWTEPTHVVETPEDLDGDNDVLMEVAEVETVTPLTADELEAIRQEAYKEGLQQGLEEGREKGEKLGHDTGLAQGLKAGHEEGRKEGYDVGKNEGEVVAKNQAELQRNSLQTQLHGFMQALNEAMLNQQQEVETILPTVIEHLAKAVVTEELSQGSEHIVHLVKQAIAALPVKLKDFTIEINHNDFPFIETALEQKQFSANLQSNEIVEAGGCLIHSEKSLIDFTLSNRWDEVLKDYHQRLQIKESSENELDELPEDETGSESNTLEQASEEAGDTNNQDAAQQETQEDLEVSADTIEPEAIIEPQGLVDIPDLIEEEYQAESALNTDETEKVNVDENIETSDPIENAPAQDAAASTEEITTGAIEETASAEQQISDVETETEDIHQQTQSIEETSLESAPDTEEKKLSPDDENLNDEASAEASSVENTSDEVPQETQASAGNEQAIETEEDKLNQPEDNKNDEETP